MTLAGVESGCALKRLESLFAGVAEGAIKNGASADAIAAMQFAHGAVKDELYISTHPLNDQMMRTQLTMKIHGILDMFYNGDVSLQQTIDDIITITSKGQ